MMRLCSTELLDSLMASWTVFDAVWPAQAVEPPVGFPPFPEPRTGANGKGVEGLTSFLCRCHGVTGEGKITSAMQGKRGSQG